VPTIVDSLFLELGIDTSKFSADQKRALEKIAEFEKKAKGSARKSTQAVKTVGEAFKDIAASTAVGRSAAGLDSFATKLKALGTAGEVSGGAVAGGLGGMAVGLGALLSPATLAVAALGLLTKGAWDLNKVMTEIDTTLERQTELTGMSATSLKAWGEAARDVGGQPTEIPDFLTDLNTKLAGGMTGFGNPAQLLTGLAMLGVKYRPGQSMENMAPELIAGYQRYAKSRGGGAFGRAAARAMAQQTGVYDESLFKMALPGGGGVAAYEDKKKMTPPDFDATVKKSLLDQRALGHEEAMAAYLAQAAYKDIQDPMLKLVGLVTDLLGWSMKAAEYLGDILDWLKHPIKNTEKALADHPALAAGAAAAGTAAGAATAILNPTPWEAQWLVRGIRNNNPGNLKFAGQKGAVGQDAEGFAIFGSFGAGLAAMRRQLELDYSRGEKSIAAIISSYAPKAENDTAAYIKRVAGVLGIDPNRKLDAGLLGQLMSAMITQEIGTGPYASVIQAVQSMISAAQGPPSVVHHNRATHHTVINGGIAVQTQATDAKGVATGIRGALSTQPLLDPGALQQITLSTTGAR
jgi:hypothetical protein